MNIENVELDLRFYSGKDEYSDGDDKEEELLRIVKEGKIEEALKTSKEWTVLYHLSPIRENLLDWYSIEKTESVLEIGSGCGALSGILARKAGKVTGIELSKRRSLINAYKNKECSNLRIIVGNFSDIELDDKFDVITLIGVLEYAELYIKSKSPYRDFLAKIMTYLKPGGRLLIAIENKMGLKYLNGANEDHFGQVFAGVNDYVYNAGIRTFSKNELKELLDSVNAKNVRFYYPMPDYKLPDTVYSDEHMPQVGNLRYYKCNYDSTRMYFYNEAMVFDQFCKDELFGYFANSFLVEVNSNRDGVRFAKYNRERKEQYRIKTIEKTAGKDKIITKEAMNDKAAAHACSLLDKGLKLNGEYKNLTIHLGEIKDNAFIYKHISGESLDKQFYPLRHDVKEFLKKLEELNKKIYDYNDEYLIPFQMTDEFVAVFGRQEIENTRSLKHTNIDAVFHNIVEHEGKAYLIDCEWVFDFPIPDDFVVWRNIEQLYSTYTMYLKPSASLNDVERSLGFSEKKISCYKSMERHFSEYVFGKGSKELYKTNYVKSAYAPMVHSIY